MFNNAKNDIKISTNINNMLLFKLVQVRVYIKPIITYLYVYLERYLGYTHEACVLCISIECIIYRSI